MQVESISESEVAADIPADLAETPRVVGVGFPLGRAFIPDHPDALVGAVAYRGEYLYLPWNQYRLWLTATRAPTLSEFSTILGQQQYRHEDLDELVNGGLVLTLGLDRERTLRQLERHRLLATGIGLGVDEDDQSHAVIATSNGEPAVRVDALIYMLWAESIGGHAINKICSSVSQRAGSEPARTTAHLLLALPTLMTAHVLFLDRL